jgi:hypothetical protein
MTKQVKVVIPFYRDINQALIAYLTLKSRTNIQHDVIFLGYELSESPENLPSNLRVIETLIEDVDQRMQAFIDQASPSDYLFMHTDVIVVDADPLHDILLFCKNIKSDCIVGIQRTGFPVGIYGPILANINLSSHFLFIRKKTILEYSREIPSLYEYISREGELFPYKTLLNIMVQGHAALAMPGYIERKIIHFNSADRKKIESSILPNTDTQSLRKKQLQVSWFSYNVLVSSIIATNDEPLAYSSIRKPETIFLGEASEYLQDNSCTMPRMHKDDHIYDINCNNEYIHLGVCVHPLHHIPISRENFYIVCTAQPEIYFSILINSGLALHRDFVIRSPLPLSFLMPEHMSLFPHDLQIFRQNNSSTITSFTKAYQNRFYQIFWIDRIAESLIGSLSSTKTPFFFLRKLFKRLLAR